MKKCENCEHFFYDCSTGASECGRYDNMTEEKTDKYYMDGNSGCPFWEEELEYTEITKEEAKVLYGNGDNVYISNDLRKHWKLPASYEYSSHAPTEELFDRSIPKGEGKTRFYK